MTARFLICDLRAEWNWRPYVTFWRPNNANYAYPLVWAGDYTEDEVMNGGWYYTTVESGILIRFPILRSLVEPMAVAPEPGHIDGDIGPVVRNSPENCAKLRKLAYQPALLAIAKAELSAAISPLPAPVDAERHERAVEAALASLFGCNGNPLGRSNVEKAIRAYLSAMSAGTVAQEAVAVKALDADDVIDQLATMRCETESVEDLEAGCCRTCRARSIRSALYASPQASEPAPQVVGELMACGIPDPSSRDCQHMKEVGGGLDGERYSCAVCGKGYFLDYEEMK